MSFLLDALGKAENNRDQGLIPELRTPARRQQSPMQGAKRLAVLVGLMLLSFVMGYMARPYLQATPAAEFIAAPTPQVSSSAAPKNPPPVVATAPSPAPTPTPTPTPARPVSNSPVKTNSVSNTPAGQPAFELSVISYSKNAKVRFVMLNSNVMFEGDELATGERVVKIEQASVTIEKDGQQQRIDLNR